MEYFVEKPHILQKIGGETLRQDIAERAKVEGRYILENGCTIRSAGEYFDVSKSTVHYDVSMRLREVDETLYAEVKKILDKNFNEKHIRGGKSTKEKYSREK